ncbi:signal peptidase I [Orenia metallireducens]|jgi:signal peptidase I|uniref:signal peptidase I n=1 Tax=Orenia metallireducens TaxID=1413210 RepID=UPI000A8688E7|nr:signal peptidase I [Orenia metallireducens]
MLAIKDEIKELIESVLIAGVLAFFIITFVVQSFVVHGHSMDPTLADGERLFVNKFIYRFHPPQRGDIIVLKPKGDPKRKYIKRVIGLPGDKIEIKEGSLYINDKKIEEDYINESYIRNRLYRMYNEDRQEYEVHSTAGPFHVPEDHVFAMGDNRNNSSDSRNMMAVGYVSYKDISGKAFWVYWPITEMKVIDEVSYPELN